MGLLCTIGKSPVDSLLIPSIIIVARVRCTHRTIPLSRKKRMRKLRGRLMHILYSG